MPGTYNNIIKLLRATKRQTKPVDDEFLAGEEYDDAAKSAKDVDSQADVSDGRDNEVERRPDNKEEHQDS